MLSIVIPNVFLNLQLYESYCLHILLCALNVVDLSAHQVHELDVCWNNAYIEKYLVIDNGNLLKS